MKKNINKTMNLDVLDNKNVLNIPGSLYDKTGCLYLRCFCGCVWFNTNDNFGSGVVEHVRENSREITVRCQSCGSDFRIIMDTLMIGTNVPDKD